MSMYYMTKDCSPILYTVMELSNVRVSVQANDRLITRGGPCTRTTVEPFGRVFLNGHVCSYSARRSLSRNSKVLECFHELVFYLFFFVIFSDFALFLYFLFFPFPPFYFHILLHLPIFHFLFSSSFFIYLYFFLLNICEHHFPIQELFSDP